MPGISDPAAEATLRELLETLERILDSGAVDKTRSGMYSLERGVTAALLELSGTSEDSKYVTTVDALNAALKALETLQEVSHGYLPRSAIFEVMKRMDALQVAMAKVAPNFEPEIAREMEVFEHVCSLGHAPIMWTSNLYKSTCPQCRSWSLSRKKR